MLKLNKSDIKGILISCAISVGTGGLSGFLSMISNNTFDVIQKPPLTPPTFVFPIVWLILYLLMGLSAYLIYKTDSPIKKKALTIYVVSLALNFVWPFLFFVFQAFLLSFIWLIVLWATVLYMILEFFKINTAAALLQIPYLLWLSFAAYLNFAIYLLN